MAETIRWGILSTGAIAREFAEDLQVVPDATLLAVGSRSQDSADAFGDDFNIERRYASYEALVQDDDIDAIYIGTPHPFHKNNSILCLNHGKAVLCEKPFTMNAREAQQVIDVAREKGIFLMEAMWTRYIPAIAKLRELLADNVIGDINLLDIDFGFRAGLDPQHRLFNRALGGGTLLDIGVYSLSMASMAIGTPSRIQSMAHIGETGVDESAAIILGYDNCDTLTTISTSVRTDKLNTVVFNGTKGRIIVHALWWAPCDITVEIYGEDTTKIHLPLNAHGYNYQAEEVGRCLRAGLTESDIMPLDETLSIMKTMDAIREQWGLSYPADEV
ncbi:MAG: Gfo/Idh/MocA family protein [Aggregatilineales bacterium]